MVAALIIGWVPFLNKPFSWQMTFFHEISHGLAALITGGHILKIELHFSGSGLCYTSGGLKWIISLAGYAGAAFWGVLIYFLGAATPKGYGYLPAALLIIILSISGLLYIRDFQSWAIILIIIMLYAAALRFKERISLNLFFKLAGLYVILDALKAPIALFYYPTFSDAASLAAQTGVPAFFWIVFWLAWSALGIILIWKIEKKQNVSQAR